MRTLQELTNAQEALSEGVAEFNTVRRRLALEAADKKGQLHDLPFPIDIEIICAASRHELKEKP